MKTHRKKKKQQKKHTHTHAQKLKPSNGNGGLPMSVYNHDCGRVTRPRTFEHRICLFNQSLETSVRPHMKVLCD